MVDDANYIKVSDYSECLRYIEKHWSKLTCYHPKDHFTHLGLPHPFVAPNSVAYKNDQFYWDSYFIIIGLVKCGRVKLAKGMIDNFLFMQKRFNIIPMRNRFYNLGSSQPPFLTSMAREVFPEIKDRPWMKKVMNAAEHELKTYWMSKSITELHMVYNGLSRYCDHFITHLAAEHESGWDMTSRFHSHCLDYLPVDLNCALYKYENDLAEYYYSINDKRKYKYYASQHEKRKKTINKLMWNLRKGFFFDYNYKQHKQSTFYSVAGFYPMWAKLATHAQAKRMIENLHVFEHEYGLANTQSKGLAE